MPNVVKVQAGYQAQPLSAYLKQPAPPAAPAIDFPVVNEDLVKTNFFDYLDFSPQLAPPGKETNWVGTVPGRNWNVVLRMYGALEPWFAKAWRPGEIEEAKN